jgi:thiol-disulfide isomerase/thioredoxin
MREEEEERVNIFSFILPLSYSDNCPFCRELVAPFEEFASLVKPDGIKVVRLSVNDRTHGAIIRGFKVSAVPTIKFIRDGTVYNITYVGQDAADFVDFVRNRWSEAESEPFPEIKSAIRKAAVSMEEPNTIAQNDATMNSDATIAPPSGFGWWSDPSNDLLYFYFRSYQMVFSRTQLLQGVTAALLVFAMGFLMGYIVGSDSKTAAVQQQEKKKHQ